VIATEQLRRQTVKNVIALILVLAVAAGGYYWYQGRDTRYARQVLDCIYDGSFETIKDTMADKTREGMDNPQVKAMLSKAGAQFKQDYGEVKSLDFKSKEPLKDSAYVQAFGEGSVEKTWTVTSDKGRFDWTLYVDKDGKLLGMNPGKLTPL
jgi:uncharacterized protein HemX